MTAPAFFQRAHQAAGMVLLLAGIPLAALGVAGMAPAGTGSRAGKPKDAGALANAPAC